MNCGLEDMLLLNILKFLEVNAIIKNNDEHIGKYDDRFNKGIYRGYATNSKGCIFDN